MRSPSPQSAAVASEVRAAIARSRKTQADLARVLGVRQQAVSARLAGRVPFRADEIATIAAWLDVPVATLFPESVAS